MGRKRKPRSECLLCGNTVKRYGKKFCSQSCASTYRIIPYLERREHRECPICHKKFSEKPALMERGRKYCSRGCADKAQIKKHTFICSKCKKQKTEDDFYIDRHKPRGHVSRCKQCCSEIATKVYSLTPKRREASFRDGALRRGLEYSLSHEQFMSFWQKPCHYCGDEIKTIGLDRVDNENGYSFDNVVSCCKVCNSMKSRMGYTDFLVRCNRIACRALGGGPLDT